MSEEFLLTLDRLEAKTSDPVGREYIQQERERQKNLLAQELQRQARDPKLPENVRAEAFSESRVKQNTPPQPDPFSDLPK